MNNEQKVLQIAIEDIIPNRFQPRLAFDEEGLKELSDSIKQHGIIQPLVLRKLGNKYEIIAGERRYKAATMAGLKTVPAIVSDINDNESAELALVENIQRRNLTPIEEAKSYKNLLDRGYMTQEQLAEKMGVSQSSVANKLRLLNLAPEVQDALLQEKISERHARSLLNLPQDEQVEWLQKIINKRLTVRQLDLEIKKVKGDAVEEEIPLVNPQPDLEKMINNATDIQVVAEEKKQEEKANPTPAPTTQTSPEPKDTQNKFFNFLEDEVANTDMSSIPTVNPEEELKNSVAVPTPEPAAPDNNIEVLDDIGMDQNPPTNPVTPTPETTATNEPLPYFFGNQTNGAPQNNQIEEIDTSPKEEVVDPMDSVIKLDPNYTEIVKQEQGLDLKTAINKVRELVTSMQTEGFNISLDEVDLDANYQMTININKDNKENKE